MAHSFSAGRRRLTNWLHRVEYAWFSIVLILTACAVFLMLSLLSVKIGLEYGTENVLLDYTLRPLGRWVLAGLLGGELHSVEQQEMLAGEVLEYFIVLTSILMALIPGLAYRRIKMSLQTRQGLKSVKVETIGEDDLQVMARHYRGAESVLVISGDFSWLCAVEGVRSQVERLLTDEQITFVTWKGENEIKQHVDTGIFGKIQGAVKEDYSKEGVKCSFIRYRGGERRLLYLYDLPSGNNVDEREFFVGIIVEQQDTRYLLRALETLCRPSVGCQSA